MVVIKLQFKEDIRRVTVDHWLNFSELRNLALTLFENALPSAYVFKYKDDEGDLITVSSDRELSEAFRLGKDQEIVRISIFPQQENKPNPNANSNSNDKQASFIEMLLGMVQGNPFLRDLLNNLEIEVKSVPDAFREFCKEPSQVPQSDVVHGAMCDGCNVQIRGIRYKCKTCPDYDLCEKCFDIKGVHVPAEHQFEKILKPTGRSGCPYYQRRHCSRQPEDVPQSEVLHPATCDGCGARVKGIRYKCNNCLDYDLCQACKDKNIHSDHTFTALLRPTFPMHCRRNENPHCRKQECSNPKAEEPVPKPVQVQTQTPVITPISVQIPIKVEQPTPKPVSIVAETPKVEQPAPKVEQPTPAPVPVPSAPVVPSQPQAPKIPETILQSQSPKEDRPLSPFEQKLKQLEEMGFLNRAKNVELMVKHSGDMVRIVRDLLDA